MMQMRKPVEALGYFEKSLALQPSFREAHVKAASILRDMGRQSDVVHHLTKAIALDPEQTSAYLYLGDTLNNLKRFNEAIETYVGHAVGIWCSTMTRYRLPFDFYPLDINEFY